MTPNQSQPVEGMATQSDPVLQRRAKLSQVVDYSEFLNELAAQRHTVLKKYAGYKDHCYSITDPIDALIRDVLRHIEQMTPDRTDI